MSFSFLQETHEAFVDMESDFGLAEGLARTLYNLFPRFYITPALFSQFIHIAVHGRGGYNFCTSPIPAYRR